MSHKRVDGNQTDIVATFRAYGAVWIATSGDPSIGFDGLVAFRGRLEIVEIKDGSKPMSQRRLTPREAKRSDELQDKGVAYNVIENVKDAIALIGKMR
jgi:hypothetical protein